MRLAQKMIVAGALLLDRIANSNLNPEASLCGSYVYSSRRRVGAQELGALWFFHFSVRGRSILWIQMIFCDIFREPYGCDLMFFALKTFCDQSYEP